MNIKRFVKVTIFGVLIWLVPFVVSFGFYNRERQLMIDETYFKSIMVVVLSAIIVLLSIYYFKSLKSNYIQQGLIAGLWWLVINLGLDAVILLPSLKTNFGDYFMQIGIRYLMMPIIAIGIGCLLKKRSE